MTTESNQEQKSKKPSLLKKASIAIGIVATLLTFDHLVTNVVSGGEEVAVADSTITEAPAVDTAKAIAPADTAKNDTTKK